MGGTFAGLRESDDVRRPASGNLTINKTWLLVWRRNEEASDCWISRAQGGLGREYAENYVTENLLSLFFWGWFICALMALDSPKTPTSRVGPLVKLFFP